MVTKQERRTKVVDKAANGPHKTKDALYYGHHKGTAIWRLDDATGNTEVVLTLEESPCTNHIASPHYDEETETLFFHGVYEKKQLTFALKNDEFYGPLAPFYLRPWLHTSGRWYGLCKYRGGCQIWHTKDPLTEWQPMGQIFKKIRHAYYHKESELVYYSRIGDTPERIFCSSLRGMNTEEEEVIRAVHDWEGADQPPSPSKSGAVGSVVNQLRDPMVYENTLYYSFAGEQGIAKYDL